MEFFSSLFAYCFSTNPLFGGMSNGMSRVLRNALGLHWTMQDAASNYTNVLLAEMDHFSNPSKELHFDLDYAALYRTH